MSTVGNQSLAWRGDALCYRGREYARLVPDSTYPNMWRVECNGRISDLTNLTRARDAARAIVLSILNTQETAAAAPSMRSPALGGTPIAPAAPNHSQGLRPTVLAED